jgi:hypothetical protein
MGRQQTLPLDGPQSKDALWPEVGEEDRREVVEILARLMLRTVHQEFGKGNSDDDCKD